jgi:flagellar hook-associated protein 2
MGSIVSSGVGSGLDVQGIVAKLVAAEGQPKTVRLNSEEAKVQAKLSALGTLRSALASFRDTVSVLKDLEKFRGRKATASSSDFVSVKAGATAAPGTFSIEVEQLAQAQKLRSGTYAASTTQVGTGTLTIALPSGGTVNVVIDSTNNTLAGVAAAINASAARDAVTATVINGDGDVRLTLTARATGEDAAVAVSQTGGDAAFATFVSGITELQPPLDAEALIDGILVTSATNTISGALAGVAIDLRAENEPGKTTDVTIGYDLAGARKAVDDFVKSYNGLVDALKSVSSYDSTAKKGGPLFGDAGVNNIGYQLRREVTSAVAGLGDAFDMLADIGVSVGVDGKLTVDGTKLDAAFASNFDAVGSLFATTKTGVAPRLATLLDGYLQTGGVFDERTKSLNTTIDDITDRREALNQRLESLQARYLKEFNALDGLLAQLQSTSNFLTQQLSKLPGVALFNSK